MPRKSADRGEADNFRPHAIEWTPDRVRRFWDHYSTNPAMKDDYFAKMVGASLIKYVSRQIRIGTAVDIGCGRGDLIEFLVKRGNDAFGIDQSPASVEQVQKRFSGRPHFKGAALLSGEAELPASSFDSAFMVEVIEHLDDEALSVALRQAHRLIRPGGHLILTTPNEEDLRASETMCPECGSTYHRIQHVRSWSARSVTDYVAKFGFEMISAEGTVLAPYPGLLGKAFAFAYRAHRKHNPHLVYIGRRVGS